MKLPPTTLTPPQKVRPGTFERAIEKAVICVFSKFELATVTSLRIREAEARKVKARKEKVKALREKKEGPPKVPGALAMAPAHLAFLPWKRQLPFLSPAVAKALREKRERELSPSGSRIGRAEAEVQREVEGVEGDEELSQRCLAAGSGMVGGTEDVA